VAGAKRPAFEAENESDISRSLEMATAARSIAGGPKDVGLSNEFLTLGRAWNERHQPPRWLVSNAVICGPRMNRTIRAALRALWGAELRSRSQSCGA
jgi:hypothetical protein